MLSSCSTRSCGSTKACADADWKAMGKDPRDAVIDLVIADHGESAVITSIMMKTMCGRR